MSAFLIIYLNKGVAIGDKIRAYVSLRYVCPFVFCGYLLSRAFKLIRLSIPSAFSLDAHSLSISQGKLPHFPQRSRFCLAEQSNKSHLPFHTHFPLGATILHPAHFFSASSPQASQLIPQTDRFIPITYL